MCVGSDLIVLQSKGHAAVKTSGLGGPVVSNGIQHSNTAMPLKVGTHTHAVILMAIFSV